jgi:hypothetical protein
MTPHQSVRRRADSCGKLNAPVLGVGQGIESAFVSHNLTHPIRCLTIGDHFTEPSESRRDLA